jgi:DNA-binding MarR family transcriptional regulator
MSNDPNHTFTTEQLADLLSNLNAELMTQSMGDVLQILQAANLSMPRLVTLCYLRRQGTATITEISEHLNLTLGTTSQAIDQLVNSDMVERHEDAHDRRHKLITLTPCGEEIVTSVRQARHSEIVRRLSDLPPELASSLGTALTEALAALQPVIRDA